MNLGRTMRMTLFCCVLACLAYSDVPSGDHRQPNLDQVFSIENITPRGQFYETTVPDTLDLSERARLAVNALTEFLNAESGYSPYGHAFFKVQPPYMSERMYAPTMDAGAANWGKVMEALVLMRSVCGENQNLDIESKSLKGMLDYVNSSGCPYQNSRAIMCLMLLYRESPTAELKSLIDYQITRLHANYDSQGNYAYYEDPEPESDHTDYGIFNYEHQTHQHGGPIRALCQWYELSGRRIDLDLAGRFSRFVSQPKYWEPENEPRFFVGKERAHFRGHVHSYLGAMLGLLHYARLNNDPWLKEFVRNGYEYIRNIGIARIGAFGETCSIGEMTILAAELSEMGVADYWEHVDQYVRNHLTEMQFVDLESVEHHVSQMPTLDELRGGNQDEDIFQTQEDCIEDNDTTARMLERNVGAFFSDGGHPAEIPRHNWTWTVCCVGNGAKGMYYAWKSILHYNDGIAQINLLLNRASPWLDIDSYLPYEGKVVVKNKAARTIGMRIPQWVDKEAVVSRINGTLAMPYWIGGYLMFDQVEPGDVIVVEFPVVETTETYTLKWKQQDRWFESNWAQDQWQPGSDQYVCRFRGNTLVEITPVPNDSTEGLGYPLYQRDYHKQNKIPMERVVRFVADASP